MQNQSQRFINYLALAALIFSLLIVGAGHYPPTGAQTSSTRAFYIRRGPTDPATCTANSGAVFFNTTTDTLKVCSATNTWSAAGAPAFTGGAVTSPILAPDGSAAAPAYSFSGAPNMGIYRSGSSIAFAVSGNNIGSVSSESIVIEGSAPRIGSGGGPLKIHFGNRATPGGLIDGDEWTECSGVSPARTCTKKIMDGGAARTLATVTY